MGKDRKIQSGMDFDGDTSYRVHTPLRLVLSEHTILLDSDLDSYSQNFISRNF